MPPPLPITNADRARHAAALIERGQLKAAERLLKDVLKADPNQIDSLIALGVLSGMRGQLADAVKHLKRAAQRSPGSQAAQYNLGQALIRLGRHAEAAEALQQAVAIEDQPQFHEKLGDCLRQLGQLDKAATHFSRAVQLNGNRAGGMLLSSLIETKRRICEWEGLGALEMLLLETVRRGEPVEPLLMHYVTDDPVLHRRNATTYVDLFLRPAIDPAMLARRFEHPKRERQRLRIGYLCSDFRNHATAHLIAGMIEHHDRQRFEIVALSFGADDASDMRRRLVAAFDRFVDLSRLSSDEIARKIHGLGIDILVDLNGYIANGRPEIFAARPAPIQCHYLAFPGTLGSADIDYMIVDPVIVPNGEDGYFTEALVRLPDCYQANDNKRVAAASMPSRQACGLPEVSQSNVVLASFNNAIKLSPVMFDIWMRVLAAVPGSVLWLFADDTRAPDNLRREATQRGVDPARLVFAPYASPADHLARLRYADLLLDSFPYGAHTTASDSLWMGVPVLTATGRSFASRVGASLLKAAGLPELISPSLDAYEREAIALARDPGRRAALKSRLTATRDTCALFDTARFTRHLEAAYLEMWARWLRGEKPAAIDVPPATRAG